MEDVQPSLGRTKSKAKAPSQHLNTPKKSKNSKVNKRVTKENSISSASAQSGKPKNSSVKAKANSTDNKEKVSKNNAMLQKIALIRTKLENVLKEKFTSVDLVAEENSNKIFEDFKFLAGCDIKIDSL